MNSEPWIYPSAGLFAGVDEVGRGPLIGAVITAAVILDPNNHIEKLTDSKKITDKKREILFKKIKKKALAWSLGRAEADEIDEINVLAATMLAMKRAIEGLSITPDFVLIDGNNIPSGLTLPVQAIVKGDLRVAEISAASILAKVIRDREMKELDVIYPQYGFAKHKGYSTKMHMAALKKHGIIEGYRKSFKPVKKFLIFT
ncbi:ribonuclease HII [Candidatus Enterovibrio altilux]|uniref:ribonuclease HII n=1 Tax=Candidatus Enterovibrio altilux TaxID=1927128 RepID=UPI001237E992|nr:ribonuclease HII [Candidatus Enterovibrio luxaltus]